MVATVLIVAATAAVLWSRACLGPAGRRAAVERFAGRAGLPAGSVDAAAARRVVRRDRVALAGVALGLPAGQHLLEHGLLFSAIAAGYAGLAAAALVGHLTDRAVPAGPRVVHATSRTVTAYVPPWLLGTAAGGAAAVVGLAALWAGTARVPEVPIEPGGGGAAATAALVAATLGALAVSLWAARLVAGGRQAADSAEHLAVDDALRAQTVRDCLHLTAATTVVAATTLTTWFGWAADPRLQQLAGQTKLVPLLVLGAVAVAVRCGGVRRRWRDVLHADPVRVPT